MRRRTALLASALLALAGTGLFTAPAHAVGGTVACTGSSSTTYSPGLTNTAQSVTATTTNAYSSCLVVLGGGITGAVGNTTQFTSVRSCTDLLNPRSSTGTVQWDNATQSTWAGTTTFVQQGSVLVSETIATVTSGPFNGQTLDRTVAYANISALTACSSPGGLTSLPGGVLTLAVLPV
ncbi:hypothetical protein [Streptomyces atroolivaceus]|uniref:hypothetical protein n=1 Tax=Streptomyces atroolivaceus TaxID=66869 RepID=UPI0037AFE500